MTSCDFVAGCIGGSAGVAVGHPLDTLKAVYYYKLYTVECAMYSAHGKLYTVQCTWYTVHC